MAKSKLSAEIVSHKKLSEDVFDLIIKVPKIAKDTLAGQFVSVYLNDKSKLLPRPISVCEVSDDGQNLRLVYRVTAKGSGTDILSNYKSGDIIEVLGPLGNGFSLDFEDCILVGGGIGIPPMLELGKRLKGNYKFVLGYRDNATFLKEDFEKYGEVFIATDDGSVGTKGTVIDCIKENNLKAKTILACGPTPMLRALKEYASANDIECYISLEERMACGIGACLACVCKTKEVQDYSKVKNTRICKEGPVFNAREVEI